MNKFESKEDYLERILMLTEQSDFVRAIDIATSMNYSKPSVSIALKKLKYEDYITVDETNGSIKLTKKGYEVAIEIYERHKILSTALMMLGVDPVTAKEDACKIEHVISDETVEAIRNHVEKMI